MTRDYRRSRPRYADRGDRGAFHEAFRLAQDSNQQRLREERMTEPKPATIQERVKIAAVFFRETAFELLALGVDPDVLRRALDDTVLAVNAAHDAEREAGLNGNG